MVAVVVVDLEPMLRLYLMKAAQVAEAVVDGLVRQQLLAQQTLVVVVVALITELVPVLAAEVVLLLLDIGFNNYGKFKKCNYKRHWFFKITSRNFWTTPRVTGYW
jgi:hypothetical protein